jgi:hypothetical protein
VNEDAQPMQSITFRLPPTVIEQLAVIAELAAQTTEQPVTQADVYRWAFHRYLFERGVVTPGPSGIASAELLDALREHPPTEHDADGPTKTVCVHVAADVREQLELLLEQRRKSVGPMLARGLTVSQLYAAAVGELLLALGVRVPGWNC